MTTAKLSLVLAGAVAAATLAACDQADRQNIAEKARQQSTVVAQTIDDAAITAKVKAALTAADTAAGASIDVDTVQGKVTLTGRLPSREQVDNAVRVASAVDGVKGVENHLAAIN
jgi:hyperosmotically inducible protein